MISKVNVLNIKVHNISKPDLLNNLTDGILVTPNVDHLVRLQHDRDFYKIYKEADWVVCDSKIVAIALKFLGSPVQEAIPGSSFFSEYYTYHKNRVDVKIFLLGAADGIADRARININQKIGREIVVGAHSPSYGFEINDQESRNIVDLINRSSATVLVVGVGAPKQEKWIFKYKDKFSNIKLFMPLGATIDFEAGNIRRAPTIFQKLALEWFYRMCVDPKRLIKRYLVDDLPFFYYIILQKIGKYTDPFGLKND